MQAALTSEAAAAAAAMPPPAPRPQLMGPCVQGAPSLAMVDGEEDGDSEDDDEEEDVIIADGRFSPPPMDIALIAGQEVVNEEDDYRWLGAGFMNVQGARHLMCRIASVDTASLT